MENKIFLGGLGGQGVVLGGKLLGMAAVEAVSYTHLDVYKRQPSMCAVIWRL